MPPTISEVPNANTATPTNMHYIIQGTLWCKGYNPGGFTGIFGPNAANAIRNFQADAGITQDGIIRSYIMQGLMNTDGYASFQQFVCLVADGIAGKRTWASLLKSSGDTSRPATAFDTSTRLTVNTAAALKSAGYDTVGRYLTNTPIKEVCSILSTLLFEYLPIWEYDYNGDNCDSK